MQKLLTINLKTNPARILRIMQLQKALHVATIALLGDPPTRRLRDEVGNDAISSMLMQAGTMLSAFYDAETGKDTDGIALGNRLIDAANQWLEEQTLMN